MTADDHAQELNAEYKSDCKLLEITYGDVEDLKAGWWLTVDITGTNGPNATQDSNVTDATDWNDATPTYGCWAG